MSRSVEDSDCADLEVMASIASIFSEAVDRALVRGGKIVLEAFKEAATPYDATENSECLLKLDFYATVRPGITPSLNTLGIIFLLHLRRSNIVARLASRTFGESVAADKLSDAMLEERYINILDKYELESLARLAKAKRDYGANPA